MKYNMKKTTSKVTATPKPKPVKATASVVEEVKKIAKLEPFGNEDMHKVVSKINEIIDAQ